MNTQFRIIVETADSNAKIQGVTEGFEKAGKSANSLTEKISKIGGSVFALNQIKSALDGVNTEFNNAIKPGIEFNSSMKEMQAITGVTDSQLEKLGGNARQLAKDYGIDAAGAVESNKLLLSQLSPEIANSAEGLDAMTRNAAILSKQLKGDTAGATEILTTAMNQYGISLDDPIAASKTMAEMMNIMSAAAKEGSAELPQIKMALQQSGMVAKTANVSFAELNAGIQVLDKAGKKGAEGGVALRNVMTKLSEGNFMSRTALDMLKTAHIDVDKLGDKSLSLSQRLSYLKPIVNDTAAMTSMFGTENAAAAIALVSNSSEVGELTKKIVGTNTAVDMAKTQMGSFEERMARINARFKDWGISIFNATEGFIPFIKVGMGGLQMLANLSTITALFSKESMIATAAQWLWNAAMTANPIGMIVVAVGALITGLIVAYNKSETFRAVLAGIMEVGKLLMDVFIGIGKAYIGAFTLDINMVKAGAAQAANAITEIAHGGISKAFDKGYDKSIAESKQKAAAESAGQAAAAQAAPTSTAGVTTQAQAENSKVLAGYNPHDKKKKGSSIDETASNITSGGSKNINIHLTIHKLQDKTEIHTTNIDMAGKQAGEKIMEMITMAVNSLIPA